MKFLKSFRHGLVCSKISLSAHVLKDLRTTVNFSTYQSLFSYSNKLRDQARPNEKPAKKYVPEYEVKRKGIGFSSPFQKLRYEATLRVREELVQSLNFPIQNETLSQAETVDEILNTLLKKDECEPFTALDVIQSLFKIFPVNLNTDNKIFVEEIKSHKAYPLLINYLEELIEDLDNGNTATVLFNFLCSLPMNIRSPIMNKLYVKVQNHFDELDLESLTYFIDGINIYNRFSIKNYGAEESINWQSVACSRQFQKVLSRYKLLVDYAKSPNDVQKLLLISKFFGHMLSHEKITYFFDKYIELMNQGSLDPKKAETPEHLSEIIRCNIHFLHFLNLIGYWKEGDDTGIIKILQSFGEHINYLSADKCEVLLHELKRFPKLPEIYNTLIKRIKDKAVFEISPTPETRIAIKILSELNIANESHDKLTRYHTELKESYLTRNEKMKLISRSSSNYNNKKILTNEPLDNVSFLNAYLCRHKLKNI